MRSVAKTTRGRMMMLPPKSTRLDSSLENPRRSSPPEEKGGMTHIPTLAEERRLAMP